MTAGPLTTSGEDSLHNVRDSHDGYFTASDIAAIDPENAIGEPGEYPFTRGIHPSMYRGRLWTMRQFAGCSLQSPQPEVNLIRVAYQAMAAVLGGCQSLHTNSFDETLALPTEHAVMLALRTQQVLAHETGIAEQVAPQVEHDQIDALRQVKRDRSAAAVAHVLKAVRQTATRGGNLMPALIDAAHARATVGEIVSELKAVFGGYHWHEQ